MSKVKETNPEEKLAEGKKNSKAVNKKAAKKKVGKEAKKLGDKMLLEIAADLPAGQGNAFMQLNLKHDKADEMVAAALEVRRKVRAEFKSIKCDMDVLNRVRKLRSMDPDDALAKMVTEALYLKQLGIKMTPAQEELVAAIDAKRKSNQTVLAGMAADGIGKETGSGTDHEAKAAAIPERNETIAPGVKPTLAASPQTH